MTYKLSTPTEADKLVARLFAAAGGRTCHLLAHEDRCFSDDHGFGLGTIFLKATQSSEAAALNAVRRGIYEWELPNIADATASLQQLLGAKKPAASAEKKATTAYLKAADRIDRALDNLASVGVRLGFVHPRFDARNVEGMPFRRAATVVADTTSVLQGALDFAANFLHPVVRIKIPAIVHMEIVNQADRFFKHRRSSHPNASAALLDHIVSQGGLRVLLRLELRPETEIERTAAFGDPLRNAFQRDTEDDLGDLNLSTPLRSFCDRLIVEAARQHQAITSRGHPVLLLTSDQGLARMALTEGIDPLFFQTVKSSDVFGRRLTGTGFNPFTGHLYKIPLTRLLWEFAATFGSARLSTADNALSVEVASIGDGLTWAPFHSRDELLWVRTNGIDSSMNPLAPTRTAAERKTVGKENKARNRRSNPTQMQPGGIETPQIGFYKFKISSMIRLVGHLATRLEMQSLDVQGVLATKDADGASEYRKFLASGDIIIVDADTWRSTKRLEQLWTALQVCDYLGLRDVLNSVPSYKMFADILAELRVLKPNAEIPFGRRAIPTYGRLATIACAAAPIVDEGLFATPSNPPPAEFARIAIRSFDALSKGERLVSVGQWLECLIRDEGIHPINARTRLEEANSSGALRRSTEGSTTDTRHDRHSIEVLEVVRGEPRVATVHLYRGDFLIPNKSSVSIRIEEGRK